jgi:CRISPR-associated protein Cas2
LEDWFVFEDNASIIMVWSEHSMPGGQSVKMLGVPPVELVEVDGLVLTKRATTNLEN